MEEIRKPRTSKTYPAIDSKTIVADEIDIQSLVKELKDYGQTTRSRLDRIIDTCQHILYNEPNVLRLSSPIKIVGDIHGQFHDLLFIFENYGDPSHERFLFLGDYVDRGHFCIQVITLLLALKCKYPKNIYLLRGNHEGKTMTQNFNFKLQCIKKYDTDIYERFLQVFCKLPLCALVDHKYFCVHGGISPELKKIKQLEAVNRFKEIQSSGLICDLLWSDPSNSNTSMWEKNKVRSCSYFFNRKQADKFISQNKIEMIIRGHEVQNKGYAYQMSDFRKRLTLTIFSAPNYCNTYKNKAGIASIKSNAITIETFTQVPHPFVFPNYMNVIEWSIPLIATKTNEMFLHLLKTIDNQTDEQTVDQIKLNALNKILFLQKVLKQRKDSNFELIQCESKQDQKQEDSDFQKLFSLKKINDKCEKYPHLPPPVIGPKNIQFQKIRIVSEECDQNPVQQDPNSEK